MNIVGIKRKDNWKEVSTRDLTEKFKLERYYHNK